MVVFDTSVLALAFDPHASVPLDPSTHRPLMDCRARIDHLIKTLSEEHQRVLIPTPVLAEYLVRAGTDRAKRLQEFAGSRVFLVAPFDQRAAVECAEIENGDAKRLKSAGPLESKAKVKFDRQIIATAKARGANAVYTGDIGLAATARLNGLAVVMTWEIPLPPADPQMDLPYDDQDRPR